MTVFFNSIDTDLKNPEYIIELLAESGTKLNGQLAIDAVGVDIVGVGLYDSFIRVSYKDEWIMLRYRHRNEDWYNAYRVVRDPATFADDEKELESSERIYQVMYERILDENIDLLVSFIDSFSEDAE